jgi:hypothetical protein
MTATLNASTSSGVILTSDTSGTLAFQSNGSTIASVGSSGMTVNSYVAGTSLLTSGTAVALTNQTSIDFTSIPSWAKRITVMFSGASTNGTSYFLIQIGSGSVVTTGYTSQFGGASSPSGVYTTGFALSSPSVASYNESGIVTLCLIGSNKWVSTGYLGFDNVTAVGWTSGGSSPTLSGALDRVRITTINGTDTYDAGTINILYE